MNQREMRMMKREENKKKSKHETNQRAKQTPAVNLNLLILTGSGGRRELYLALDLDRLGREIYQRSRELLEQNNS